LWSYQDAFEVDVVFFGGLLVLLQNDVCKLGNVMSWKVETQVKTDTRVCIYELAIPLTANKSIKF
jgi:hypothetical protein